MSKQNKRVRLENTFHNTEITVRVEPRLEADAVAGDYLGALDYYSIYPGSVERRKLRRIMRTLCPSPGCCCGGFIVETLIA